MTNLIFFRANGFFFTFCLVCSLIGISVATATEKKAPVFKTLESDDETSKKHSPSDADESPLAVPAKTLSEDKASNDLHVQGVVRQIRGSPDTDVFLQGVPERIIIPGNSKHNEIMNECLNSMKTGKVLSFTVDPVSRQIHSWKNSPPAGSESSSK